MRAITLLIFLVSMPPAATAQETTNPLEPTPENCAFAAELVRTDGASPERPHPRQFLSKCGAAGGQLLAEELLALRNVSDAETLRAAFFDVSKIRDAQVLAAALDLAADRAATIEARVIALRLLVEYENPLVTTTSDYFLLPRRMTGTNFRSGGVQRWATPLPEGWEAEASALLTAIAEDSTESEAARTAARRAARYFR